ncbi:hypothetical protein GCM10025298_07510 [Natronobiforma cellulositropha]
MFERATRNDILTEAIVTIENVGTGPDAVTELSFAGDVPRPTPDTFPWSGIYDTESTIRRHADDLPVYPGETVTLYSQSRPFSPADDGVTCSEGTTHGQLEVVVKTRLSDRPIVEQYGVSYTGTDLVDCEIGVDV